LRGNKNRNNSKLSIFKW